MLRKRPGDVLLPYQPMPKPSPFVGVSGDLEHMLWSISECLASNKNDSSRMGSPE